ncbi:MAG TPA: carbon monoxide dehydrogenase subunit G [Alphaproteobacteria bacterium]|nr:carbon monoxide dehydrogenase subunit G [Alphaproteobacteria bacterium]
MEFGGRYHFSAPRAAVWAALNDTGKLKASIPGCRRLDWTGEGTLELELQVNLGIVSPTFTGDLHLTDVVPAETYTLSGRGRGLLGRAEGAARIHLSDSAQGTELRFTAVGGADNGIMKLGKTLVGRSAQRVIDHFFSRFGETFGATVTPLPPQSDSPA